MSMVICPACEAHIDTDRNLEHPMECDYFLRHFRMDDDGEFLDFTEDQVEEIWYSARPDNLEQTILEAAKPFLRGMAMEMKRGGRS